jgi:ADP-ribosylglycohydrolase
MPKEKLIIGAIAGDIIGSVYEFNNVKSLDFDFFLEGTHFTDDSVLTMATMWPFATCQFLSVLFCPLSRTSIR